MKKYDFLIDEIPVSVFPVGKLSEDNSDVLECIFPKQLAVLIYPAWDADFGVSSYDKNNREPREPILSFAALSCFFGLVRAFPKMTLTLKYQGKIYEMPLGENTFSFATNVGKSKILCTKTLKFSDETEILTRIFQDGIATVVCQDSDLFDRERMQLIMNSLHREGVRSVIAVSFSESVFIKSVGEMYPYDALSYAVVSLCADGIRLPKEKTVAFFDGVRHEFSYEHGKLTVYPIIKYLS